MPKVEDKKKRKKRQLKSQELPTKGQVGWVCYGCERTGHVCILLSTVSHEIWFEPAIYPCDETKFEPLTRKQLREWAKSV